MSKHNKAPKVFEHEKSKKAKKNPLIATYTNFDMIRDMNDAELAFFIVHRTGCDLCEHFSQSQTPCALSKCSEYWLHWGQSPAKPIDLENMDKA